MPRMTSWGRLAPCIRADNTPDGAMLRCIGAADVLSVIAAIHHSFKERCLRGLELVPDPFARQKAIDHIADQSDLCQGTNIALWIIERFPD